MEAVSTSIALASFVNYVRGPRCIEEIKQFPEIWNDPLEEYKERNKKKTECMGGCVLSNQQWF